MWMRPVLSRERGSGERAALSAALTVSARTMTMERVTERTALRAAGRAAERTLTADDRTTRDIFRDVFAMC